MYEELHPTHECRREGKSNELNEQVHFVGNAEAQGNNPNLTTYNPS